LLTKHVDTREDMTELIREMAIDNSLKREIN
jgi:hypothetical protein